MMDMTVQVDFEIANTQYGPFDIKDADDLYYRLERAEGTGTLTGTLSIAYGLTAGDEPHNAALLTLDETQNAANVAAYRWAYFIVGTAQAGYGGRLHIYTRRRPIAAV